MWSWNRHVSNKASDTEPLPKGSYEELTEEITTTEIGITITERRYRDPRLEKIRKQLATEKLEQAFGRIRLPVWTDTQTIIFTSAPVEQITDRAILFSTAAFNLAVTPNELPDAMHRIQQAEAKGDVKTVMETKGIGKSQAYDLTRDTRTQAKADQDAERDAEIIRLYQRDKNISLRKIERHLKQAGFERTSRKFIKPVIAEYKVVTNSNHQLYYTNWPSENVTTPTKADVMGIDSETASEPTPQTETAQDIDTRALSL